MNILGIETSCDETGVAICNRDGLLAEALYSQVEVHAEYGGVVPELASRDHVRKLPGLVQRCLRQAGLNARDLDAIAYTAGPGLVGALLSGVCTAHAMARALQIPAIAVHHMEGHLLAPFLSGQPIDFPFLALLVSGGHTQLVLAHGLGDYHLLGDTLDDAVGEAFDKTAKLLGLPYPGGPHLARLAEGGQPGRWRFPRPMTDRPGLDFSFSGLKTFALNTWQNCPQSEQDAADIAHAFQEAVVDTLAIKCRRALQQTGCKRLLIAGGVGANARLRQRLSEVCRAQQAELILPPLRWCTDNGAMIAHAGLLRLQRGDSGENTPRAFPRWPLSGLSSGH